MALYGKVYEEQPLMCLSVCFLIARRRCELASQKIDWHGVKEGTRVYESVALCLYQNASDHQLQETPGCS